MRLTAGRQAPLQEAFFASLSLLPAAQTIGRISRAVGRSGGWCISVVCPASIEGGGGCELNT
jgi:hypothetical protein